MGITMSDVTGGPKRQDTWFLRARERLDLELGAFLNIEAGLHAITRWGELGNSTPQDLDTDDSDGS